MSPKKTILRTLADYQADRGSATHVRPAAIPGFQEAPEKYQKTINALLKERLIEGIKDPEGHMAISLNTHRDREIRRVLRPTWAHPAVLLFALAALTLAGLTLLV
jgi:hypothetical protein